MGTARPTFERRQLGLTLRRLRDRVGKPQLAAALALNKTRTRVVQLEDGTATISQEDLETLLNLYEVTGEERETLIELANQARKRQKRRVYVDQSPDAYQRWADLEASASEITEDALRANLGSPQVMCDQLQHLLDLDRAHGDLTIRVLPNDAFGNPLRGQSLWYFGFGDRGAPICYSPSVLGPSAYYDREADTVRLLRAFYRVWELALSRTASRRLIESLLKE